LRRKLCLIPFSHFLKTHPPRTWFGANPKQIQERSNLLVKTLKDSSSHMTEFHHAVEQYFLIQPSFKKYYQLTDKAQSAYSVTSLGIKRLMEIPSHFMNLETRFNWLSISKQMALT
jgi:hypothetical protein